MHSKISICPLFEPTRQLYIYIYIYIYKLRKYLLIRVRKMKLIAKIYQNVIALIERDVAVASKSIRNTKNVKKKWLPTHR